MLVEMLVAMAIGAFLLVALASLTAFVVCAHDRVMTEVQEAEDVGRALASLSRDVHAAAHARWAGRNGGLIFSGTSDGLVFARVVRAADGLDRMTAVRLQVRGAESGTRLLRVESALPPDAASTEVLAWGQPVSLYAGPSRIAFAYFMRLESGGEALLDDWPPGDAMPVAIRVAFVHPGSGKQPLSLRISLLTDAEPACALPDAPGCGKTEDDLAPGNEEATPAAAVNADDARGWDRYAR